jgi:hypothetical protein
MADMMFLTPLKLYLLLELLLADHSRVPLRFYDLRTKEPYLVLIFCNSLRQHHEPLVIPH